MGVAIAMGGMALASGVMGALGQSSQAKAQAMAQEIQQQQANFKAEWAHAAEQRNQMRAFQANLERNIMIEKGANRDRAIAELYLDKDFLNQKSTLSKQTSETNAQFISAHQSKGVSTTSGTARALLRQNMTAMSANMTALRQNYANAWKDITAQQNAKLAQRQFSFQEQSVFLPQTGGIVDASASMLTTGLIQAGIAGVSAGVDAQLSYGNAFGLFGGGGGATPSTGAPMAGMGGGFSDAGGGMYA